MATATIIVVAGALLSACSLQRDVALAPPPGKVGVPAPALSGQTLDGTHILSVMATQLVSGKVRAALEDVSDCVQTCEACAQRWINDPAMVDCARTCLDCAAVCQACVKLLARESRFYALLCGVGADICEACARECDKFDVDHCRVCAQACRRCAEECRRMAA